MSRSRRFLAGASLSSSGGQKDSTLMMWKFESETLLAKLVVLAMSRFAVFVFALFILIASKI